MKSFFLFLGAFVLASTLFFSCKKDSSNAEENPFFQYLKESSINIDTIKTAAAVWDYGFKFKPIRSGKINKLWLKLPTTGSFIVRLWDIAKDSIISEKTITTTTENAEVAANIDPISAQANTMMGVTVTAASFYKVSKKDLSEFEFPKTINNIEVVSYNEAKEAAAPAKPTYPPKDTKTTVAPCVNITFVAD